MNQHEINKLKMFKQVLDVASANQAAYAGIQAFADGMAAFRLRYDQLNALATQHAVLLKGITKQKKEQKELTAQKATIIAGSLRAFATATHNTLLAGKLKFGNHLFSYGSSLANGQKIELVLQLAAENLAELGPFGTTQQKIDELDGLYTALKMMHGSPRKAVIERRDLGSSIDDLFDEMDELLGNQLDELALRFKEEHPSFFHQYKDARKIIDSKGKTSKHNPPEEPGFPEPPADGTK